MPQTNDQSPRTALITGGNTGIGRVLALSLARSGVKVLIAGRSELRTRPVIDEIGRMSGATAAQFISLDLANLDSVRECVEAIHKIGSPLDLLINNAGVGGQRGMTQSGFEIAFGVNHLGHFLLTRHLLAHLMQSGRGRIVTVASDSHALVRRWNWDALHRTSGPPFGLMGYARSKLANILFTRELHRRHHAHGILSYAVHPGVIATEIWRHLPDILARINRVRLHSPEEGAAPVLHAALHADPAQSGGYFHRFSWREPSALARNEMLQRELWDRSLHWTDPFMDIAHSNLIEARPNFAPAGHRSTDSGG